MGLTSGEKLKKLRLEKGMSQENLADLLGTSKQVVSRYERNQRTPKFTIAIEYAKKLNVPVNYLLDDESPAIYSVPGIEPLPETDNLPMLGTIACGTPIFAEENIEDYYPCPKNLHANFCLRCKGDSMINARIYDGDVVFIRSQPDVENGEIAAVLIGEEATLKRVYRYENKIVLNPENPAYEPLVYTGLELDEIEILGKAVYFISAIR